MKLGAPKKTLCWSLTLFLVAVAGCDDAETSSASDASDTSDAIDDTAVDGSADTADDTSNDVESDTSADIGDTSADDGSDAVDLSLDEADETPDTMADTPVDVRENDTLYINEVVAAPMPDEADWIEIYNPGDEIVSLGGWSITDANPEHLLVVSAGTEVSAGGFLVLERNSPGSFTFGLGADDAVFLYAPDGELIDAADWEADEAPIGRSYGRFPDGTGAFFTLDLPTPGDPNRQNTAADCGNNVIDAGEACDGDLFRLFACRTFGMGDGALSCVDSCQTISTDTCVAPAPGAVINEVITTAGDAIELTNSSASVVDLSGWHIEDSDPTHQYVFPAGTTLEAGDYTVLTAGVHHTFGLASDDALYLYDDADNLVDGVDWLTGQADTSYCRMPDGVGPFQACDPHTFGAAN